MNVRITTATFDGCCLVCLCKIRAGDPVLEGRSVHADCYREFVPTADPRLAQHIERQDLEVADRDLECRFCRQTIAARTPFVRGLQVHPECDLALFPTLPADDDELESLATRLAKKLQNDVRKTVPVLRSDDPLRPAPFNLAVQFGNGRASILGTGVCRLDLSREELGALMRDAFYIVFDALWRARQLVLTGAVPLQRKPSETPVDPRKIRPTPGTPFALGRTRATDVSPCRICHEKVMIGDKVYIGSRSHAACVNDPSANLYSRNLAAIA